MSSGIYEMVKDAVGRQKDGDDNREAIWEMFSCLMNFARIGREEGMLSLEEELLDHFLEERKRTGKDLDADAGVTADADEKEGDSRWLYPYRELSGVYRFLAMMIMYLVDGTDPELLEEIAVMHYYAARYEGVDALLACMITVGVLDIRAGVNPIYQRERLLSLLSEEAANQIIDREMEREAKKKALRKCREEEPVPESFFEEADDAGRKDGPEKTKSRIMNIVNELVLEMGDPCIQSVLWNVDDRMLCACLAAMSGKARRKLFSNMPPWTAARMYESTLHFISWKRDNVFEEAETAAVRILKEIKRLEEIGEIVADDPVKLKDGIETAIAWYEHKKLCHNRKIEEEIRELQIEIDRMKRRLVEV